jgi:hypothetical protein
VRLLVIVVLELVAIVGLLVFAATVAIPLASPPPNLPTPTLPAGALRDCPPGLRGC